MATQVVTAGKLGDLGRKLGATAVQTAINKRLVILRIVKSAVRRLLKAADYLAANDGRVPPGFKDWKQFLLAALLPGTNGNTSLIKAVMVSLLLNRLWRALANKISQVDNRIDLLAWTFAIRRYYNTKKQAEGEEQPGSAPSGSGQYREKPYFDWSLASGTAKASSNIGLVANQVFKVLSNGTMLYSTPECAASVFITDMANDIGDVEGSSQVLRFVPCWSVVNDNTLTAHDHQMLQVLKCFADSADKELWVRPQDFKVLATAENNFVEARVVDALKAHGFTQRADGSMHRFQTSRQSVDHCIATSMHNLRHQALASQPISLKTCFTEYTDMFAVSTATATPAADIAKASVYEVSLDQLHRNSHTTRGSTRTTNVITDSLTVTV